MEIKIMGKKMKENEKEGYEEFEIEDALRTLERAEEIKADKELMALVQEKASKKIKAIKSIDGLRQKASMMPLDDESEG